MVNMKSQTRNNIIGSIILALAINIGVLGLYGAFTETFVVVGPYIMLSGAAVLLIFWSSVAMWGMPKQ